MKLTYEIDSVNVNDEIKARYIEAEVKNMSPKILPKVIDQHRLRYPNEEIIRVFLKSITYTEEEIIQ